ncbi:MAG: BatA domain-containing protein, partial [Bacteroidota bacterium]
MTFLNAQALWGLLALAVPIIIHFFNLQRPKQILFSNVAFVKEVKKSVVRRLRFKQWLLLLARLLAISGLVLAFARPVLIRDNQNLLQGQRSVAVVIDNSYSMSVGNEKGMYFQQALSLARNVVKAYSRQDEFLLMTTSDLRLNYNFSEQEESLEELRNLKIAQNIRSQGDILGFRNEIFARANHQLKELYLISDFQEATVLTDSLGVQLQDSSMIIKYVPLANRAQKNVYVASQKIESQIVEVDQPVEMSMQLVNDGQSDVNNLNINIWLDGKIVSTNNTSVKADATQELRMLFTPTQTGWLGGYIELNDNPVDYDNKRYFSLYVPDQEKVLVVEGQNSPNVKILFRDLFKQFVPTFVSEREISTVQLEDFRSVVFLGMKNVSSGLSDKLQTYLNEGGSMLVFPGEGAKLNEINNWLLSLRVGSLEAAVSIQDGQAASAVDLAHPVFDGVFQRSQKRRDFDAPTMFRYHPLKLNNQTVHNRILSLENQSPLLLESRTGDGLLFLATFFPGDEWTDFHVKTVFPPILFRITQIMNQTQNVQQGQEIGFFEPKRIRTTEKALINLVDAEGKSIPPEQY